MIIWAVMRLAGLFACGSFALAGRLWIRDFGSAGQTVGSRPGSDDSLGFFFGWVPLARVCLTYLTKRFSREQTGGCSRDAGDDVG